MTITLPPGAERYLGHVDVEWVDVDEDVLAEAHRCWQNYAEVSAQEREAAAHAVAVMAETNTSAGLTAFRIWFERIIGGAGYMQTFGGLAGTMAASIQAARVQVVAMKTATLLCLPAMEFIHESDTTELGPGVDEAVDALTVAAHQQVNSLQVSLGVWTDALRTLGVPLAQLEGLGIGAMAAVLRNRPIHSSRERIEHHRRPIAERLATARVSAPGDFPDRAAPNSTVKRLDRGTSEVTHYAEYDADGVIVRRVDLTGRSHRTKEGRPAPTPHTHFHTVDHAPDRDYVRKYKDVRPATPEEVP